MNFNDYVLKYRDNENLMITTIYNDIYYHYNNVEVKEDSLLVFLNNLKENNYTLYNYNKRSEKEKDNIYKIVEYLINHGANVNYDNGCHCVLDLSFNLKNIRLIQLLIDNGLSNY